MRRPAVRLSLACAAVFAAAALASLALHAGGPADAPAAQPMEEAGEEPPQALPPGHPPVEGLGQPPTPERRRRLQEHAARLGEAVAKDPKDAESWRRLGFVHQALGRASEARAAFERLLALRPDDEGGLFMRALIDEKLGDKAEAVASWEAFLLKSRQAKHREVAQKHLKHLRGEP